MSVKIDLPRATQDTVEEHCFSRVDVEVGGFLIGFIDESGTHITDAHAALAAQSGQANLTFTHEVWDEILPVLETDYPGKSIVGWYHSHPGFGVFLSAYDVFIQENFFGAPGQVALVVDPLEGSYGFLTAKEGEATKILGGKTLREGLGADGADKVDIATAEETEPRRRGGVLAAVIVGVVVGIAAAAAGWFVGSMQGQDQATSAASTTISGLEQQVADLQAQVNAIPTTPADPSPSPTPTPTPQPTPTPTPQPAGPQIGDPVTVTVRHVIREGETFWLLASRYLGSTDRLSELEAANPGVDPDQLQVGDVVVIPLRATLSSLGR